MNVNVKHVPHMKSSALLWLAKPNQPPTFPTHMVIKVFVRVNFQNKAFLPYTLPFWCALNVVYELSPSVGHTI